jgi:hypothetical protein
MTTLIPIADERVRGAAPWPVRHAGRAARAWATGVIIVVSALLLFVRLGHYAPWDDEAITAMTGRAVWQTGDTSARVDDHNYLIYRNGLLVRDLKDRFTPPLQFFVLAPVIGLLGDGNAAIRLPFALCGAVTVAILLRWMWRALPPVPLLWWGAAFALLTNVEFFLFFRQCRYYGLAMVLTAAAAYLYCHRTGRSRGIWGLSAVLAALLASQYLDYAAAVGCMVVDYAVWGRRDRRITWPQWVALLLPQVVVGAVVCSIWNPVARQHAAGPVVAQAHWVAEHLRLLALNGRDLLASGFVVAPLLAACPLLWFKRRRSWLLRGPLAVAVYIVVVSACVTPGPQGSVAEVRYLAPLLPICVAIGVLGVWGTLALRPGPRAVLLAMSAASVLVGVSRGPWGLAIGSDPLAFAYELAHPQVEPYTPLIAWVNGHVPAGESVLVSPDYMAYPLMLRAPGPTYAWQLDDPPRPDLAGLPAIHVHGRVPPDFLIACGSSEMARGIPDAIQDLRRRGVEYALVDTLPVYWQDMYRPERMWRTFATVTPKSGEAIYIYRRLP